MDLMSMDTGLYLNIIFLTTVGLATLFGLLKGLKKSLIGFLINLAFYVVFFVTLDLVISFLWTVNIAPLGGWIQMALPDFPSNVTTLEGAMTAALDIFVGTSLGVDITNVQLMALVTGIGQFVLKIVYFILYFTIGYVLYAIIGLIIRSIFITNTKVDKKYRSNNPLLGGLFGFLQGCVAVYVMLIMFGGLMSIAESLIVLIPDFDSQTEDVSFEINRQDIYQASHTILPLASPVPIPGMDQFGDVEEMVAFLRRFVDSYNTNFVVAGVASITISDPSDETAQMPLNVYLFDSVLSFNYNETQISFRKELNIVAEVAGVALGSEFIATSNFSDLTGDEIRLVFSTIARSDLISSLLPLSIELASDYLDLPVPLNTEELYAIPWKQEVANIGNIAAFLFDLANTIGVFESDFVVEDASLSKANVESLFSHLADSQLITYATSVAVSPLLELAGEPINLIITIPDGLVWAEEFAAIGSVIGTLLDTGLTIGDIGSGDYMLLLNALASVDFTVILDSKLITHALINVLSGAVPLPGLEFLTIPANIQWLDIRDAQGNIITNGELRQILLALNQIAQIAGQIDFNNLQLSNVGLLTDAAINAIFESRLLVASLTTQLLTLDLGDFPIVIPDAVFDEEGYLRKTELVSIVQSLKLVAVTLACDVGDTDCDAVGYDLSKVFTLSKLDFDSFLNSQVLTATLGKLIMDLGQSETAAILVIPNSAKMSLLIRESLSPVITANVDVVTVEELNRLFDIITAIDLSDIDLNNFEFSPELISKLKDPDNEGKLNADLITKVFASNIIHATLSDLILTLITEASDLIVVPHFDASGLEVRYI
ncbi:MAG: hypothetical protein Q8M70_06435, partial [bacterium]|nr:hypothetical protein [bacterium]